MDRLTARQARELVRSHLNIDPTVDRILDNVKYTAERGNSWVKVDLEITQVSWVRKALRDLGYDTEYSVPGKQLTVRWE